MRLQDALDEFVVQLQADGRSEHTIGNYQRHLALLARWLGPSDDLDDVTPQTLARFLVADTTRTGRSASTMNAIRTSLRVVFGWWHQAGLIRSNPARMIRRAICSPPPPKTLTDDEQRRLLDTIAKGTDPESKRDFALFSMMLATGVRLSSAISIDVEDIDLARAEILLRRVKRDRVERVFLNARTAAVLRAYLGERGSGPAFPGMHGGYIGRRQAARRLETWLDRAGIPHRGAHALRHSFAARTYANTRDPFVVQRLLHHASITSTLRYAQASDASLRSAVS